MLPGDLHALRHRNVNGVVLRVPSRPGARLPPAEHPELESAPTRDAPEACRELLVVLELEPVHQAVAVAVIVHRLEQHFPVKGF